MQHPIARASQANALITRALPARIRSHRQREGAREGTICIQRSQNGVGREHKEIRVNGREGIADVARHRKRRFCEQLTSCRREHHRVRIAIECPHGLHAPMLHEKDGINRIALLEQAFAFRELAWAGRLAQGSRQILG